MTAPIMAVVAPVRIGPQNLATSRSVRALPAFKLRMERERAPEARELAGAASVAKPAWSLLDRLEAQLLRVE